MNTGLVISMLAGISGGLVAGGTALMLEWGWLIAIALYGLCGTLTLVVSAVAAAVLSLRRSCPMDAPVRSAPASILIFVSP